MKYGIQRGKQQYFCKKCKRKFSGGKRLDSNEIISDYVEHKFTIKELSVKYRKSVSTIQRSLRKMRHIHTVFKHKDVVILMDTTYWGRNSGLMVIKDAIRGKILWHKHVKHETITLYLEGIEWLENNGFKVWGIVCDGLKGLFNALSKYNVQMCQVHQQRIIQRYLTSTPELPASIELLELSKLLTKTDKESFIGAFNQWQIKWDAFLKERSSDKTGKSRYTHQRLRSAYLSLKRNMKWLWTFYDHPSIGIPNTNNALEGTFTDIKTKLRVHSGMKKSNRQKFLDEYISRHYY